MGNYFSCNLPCLRIVKVYTKRSSLLLSITKGSRIAFYFLTTDGIKNDVKKRWTIDKISEENENEIFY